jgi:GTP-binding protein HflX
LKRSNGTYTTHHAPERAALVGVEIRGKYTDWSLRESLAELGDLTRAANAEVVARVSQRLDRPSRTYLGKGKLEELQTLIHDEEIDVVVFDDELAPAQQKALEDLLVVKVIDRSTLILDVFAQRARTREGKLQIELAQSEYLLPRLAGQWAHLERLGGGIGTRGPGEAQIETDRRLVRSRISKLKKDLSKVRIQRSEQRQNRTSSQAAVVSFVGYTNAGKSALFNRLASGKVTARNQLFSTLDTTTRQLYLPSGEQAILTDTVGFIHKLPAIVVSAFTATLEELEYADLLLHVVDVSHRGSIAHHDVVEGILDELGLSAIPRILVLNKFDRVAESPDDPLTDRANQLVAMSKHSVVTSAEFGWGLDDLRSEISKVVSMDVPEPASA